MLYVDISLETADNDFMMGTRTRKNPIHRKAAVRKKASKTKTAPSLKDFRREFSLSQPIFARLVGVSVRTVASTDSKKATDPSLPRAFQQAVRLLRALSTIMRQDFVATWLQQPLESFQGLKPLEVIERGEVDRVWDMIYRVGSGQPN